MIARTKIAFVIILFVTLGVITKPGACYAVNWEEYLKAGVDKAALLSLFNTKAFDTKSITELSEVYHFTMQDNKAVSSDSIITFGFDKVKKTLLKSITLQIADSTDFPLPGLEKQDAKYNLELEHGDDYFKHIYMYEFVLMPEGDDNINNHFLLHLDFNQETTQIIRVTYTPFNPAKVQYSGKLKAVKNGQLSGDCADGMGVFLWAEGIRFEGDFKGGKPRNGNVYAWGDRINALAIISDGYAKEGILPAIMQKTLREKPELLLNIDEAICYKVALINSVNASFDYINKIRNEDGSLIENQKCMEQLGDSGIRHCRTMQSLIGQVIVLMQKSQKDSSREQQTLDTYTQTLNRIIEILNLIKGVGVSEGEVSTENMMKINSFNDNVNSINLIGIIQSLNDKEYFKK